MAPKPADPSRPLVTVATSCYNHERYLGDYFNGLLSQTYDNVELILFDDESTDSSWEIIKDHETALREKFPRVIIERHPNMYFFKEFDEAFRFSTGDFFSVCESDDYILPTKIEDNVNYLLEHPEVGLVYSDYDTIEGDSVLPRFLQRHSIVPREGDVLEDLCWLNFIGTATACLRMSIARGCVDYAEYERRGYRMGDWPAWMDMAARTSFGYIDKSLARYRIHVGSASHPKDPVKEFEFWKNSQEVCLDYIKRYAIRDEVRDKVENDYYKFLFHRGFELYLPDEVRRGYENLHARDPRYNGLRNQIILKSMGSRILWRATKALLQSGVVSRTHLTRFIPRWSGRAGTAEEPIVEPTEVTHS